MTDVFRGEAGECFLRHGERRSSRARTVLGKTVAAAAAAQQERTHTTGTRVGPIEAKRGMKTVTVDQRENDVVAVVMC